MARTVPNMPRLYGVTTGDLNKAVRRNPRRFPANFMFQLADQEARALILQSGSSKQRGGRLTTPTPCGLS
jgi:hypothetical protein